MLCSSVSSFSLSLPALYQCTAVRVSQEKAGRTYSKGYQTPSLYVKITYNEIRVFGTQSEITICKKVGIRRIERDTLFLEDPEEVKMDHGALKLYMVKDTLMGNTNLFEPADSSKVSIKVLVKKVAPQKEAEVERLCR